MRKKLPSIFICVVIIMMALSTVQNIDEPSMGLTIEEPISSSSPPTEWPMFQRTPDSQGFTPDDGPTNSPLLWSKGLQANVKTSPAVVDGRVYVNGFLNSVSALYCLDAGTGATLWRYIVSEGRISTAPCVSDNKVFFGKNWGDGKFYCLDAYTGSLIWEADVGDMYVQGAVVVDDVIYIPTSRSGIYALYVSDGTQIWWISGGSMHAGVAVDGDVLYGISTGLKAINRFTGATIWSYSMGSVHSTPTVAYGKVFVQSDYNEYLYAIHKDTGALAWSYDLEVSNSHGVQSSPAAGFNRIFVGCQGRSDGNNFLCFNPDNGNLLWSVNTGGNVLTSAAIAGNNLVYISSGRLYAINVTQGTVLWNYYLSGSSVVASPAIYNGVVYITSVSKAYAIGNYREPPSQNQPPVADAGSDQTVNVGDLVQFDGSGSHDPDGYITTYDWDFGDGSPHAAGMNASHIYNISGVYTVTLTVWDDDNATDNDICTITVQSLSQLPIAEAGPNQTINEGEAVLLDGSASYSPSSSIEKYEWDFESDGTYDYQETSSTAPDGSFDGMTTHIYGDNGLLMVTLRVTDDIGAKDTDTCNITVNNVIPTVDSFGPFVVNEGTSLTISIMAYDQGSDDLIFTWNFELGSTIVNTYYNDGMGPDPYPSPHGTYPFSVADSVEQTYGDDGVYGIYLKVEDDDGGTAYFNTTVTVNNIAPGITIMVTPSGDEGSSLTFTAEATDSGSDDLTFEWEFEYGLTIQNTFYNNGIDPEPVYDPISNEIKSPDGVYPFSVSDTVAHTYGDDYNYTLILRVTDDDGATSTYTTTIEVDNLAPSIILFAIPYVADEGSPSTFIASTKDHGSDDLTFEWDFGDSTPLITNTYYNDGIAPDPGPSPDGIFPFIATDTLNHTYGDDYNYTLSLKVADDDGGMTTFTTTVIVQNVAPTIEPFGPFTIDEGLPDNINAISTDLGSDDLTFTWELELGPTITNIYYNDGIGPDPYPSPWGTFPYTVADGVIHTYGDNGVYNVTLTVEDDDGGTAFYTTNITVNNVAPTIDNIEGNILANFTLRVAGEKWHNVELFLYEDDREIGYAEVVRFPGSPDDQSMTIGNVRCDVTKVISAKVFYTPDDDPVNGQPNGASPCWVNITFEDGSYELLHRTFNVMHPETWEWDININQYFIGHVITFEATATDIGSDDLTFQWNFGSITTYYNDGFGPDPYPSPDGVFPFLVTDIVTHLQLGPETIILTVADDDGGTTTIIIEIL